MLKRLENKSVAVDPKTYDAYAGEYEVSPTFMVKVFKEGGQAHDQATDQPAFELFPEGENKIFLHVLNARATFTRDDKVPSMVWSFTRVAERCRERRSNKTLAHWFGYNGIAALGLFSICHFPLLIRHFKICVEVSFLLMVVWVRSRRI